MCHHRGPSRAVFLTALLMVPAACNRGGARPADAGRDIPATFDTAVAGSGGGGTGGVVGAAGTGGAGSAGGGSAPLFPCIEDWPQRPEGVNKAARLSLEPRVLWTKSLPVKGTSVASTMAVTGTGVALSIGYNLLIYDGEGSLVAQVTKAQSTGYISSPVAASDGSVFFADASNAYHVDGTGQSLWQKPLGGNQTGQEFGAPAAPALEPNGRLHVSALDGKLWTFRGEDGEVLSTANLGLWQGAPRSLTIGFGKVLLIDRGGIAAAGFNVRADGLFAPDTGTWVGEVTAGDGMDGLYVTAGYDVGVVVSRTNSTTQGREISVYDKCGNFRWRVPGGYAGPLVIGFDDDLFVLDTVPLGAGGYSYSLRRFSKDGALLAGPVTAPAGKVWGRGIFVGADGTLYYTSWTNADGYRVSALDLSLQSIWSVAFPATFAPEAAVLNADGKIFFAAGGSAELMAVQTTSPGPGRVSFAQIGRDARATRWLAP
jgi:hypothetical protein